MAESLIPFVINRGFKSWIHRVEMLFVVSKDMLPNSDTDCSLVLVCLDNTAGVWLGDEGLYICEAKNSFGTIKTGARVSVTGLGKFLLTSSVRNLWDSTASSFLRLAHIPVHWVFMGACSHLSAAEVKSVHWIFLGHDSQLSITLTLKSFQCPEINLRSFS